MSTSIILPHISIFNDMMIERSTDHRMISKYLFLQKRFFSSFSNSFNYIISSLNSVLCRNYNCDALCVCTYLDLPLKSQSPHEAL